MRDRCKTIQSDDAKKGDGQDDQEVKLCFYSVRGLLFFFVLVVFNGNERVVCLSYELRT